MYGNEFCCFISCIIFKGFLAHKYVFHGQVIPERLFQTFLYCVLLIVMRVHIRRKTTLSFVISVRPSFFPHGTTRHPLAGFIWNLILKSVEKLQFSLKYEKNNVHFTWRPTDICDNISMNYFYTDNIPDKTCKGN
jgi:hypothetical protein